MKRKLMLASSNLNSIIFPAYSELKYDGVRLGVDVQDGKIEIYTRNFKTPKLPDLEAAFADYPNGLYDGELVYGCGEQKDRPVVSGLANSAIHGNYINETNLTFWIFDYVTIPVQPIEHRVELLKNIVSNSGHYICVSTVDIVNSTEEVQSLFEEALSYGYEGLIIKNKGSSYTFGKRSKQWVKIKEINTIDLVCTEVIEGKGKYYGEIGALSCTGRVQVKGIWNTIHVNVGSGLTDLDRSRKPEYYLHRTIEVKYNNITDAGSLFLPRFVQVRIDK